MQTTSMGTTTRRGGAVALCAAAMILAGAGTAEAGKKVKRDVELVRPVDAPDADATGVLRITTTKRGRKGVLKLRNLDSRTRYEVHDADTDEVLGRVRTDRRGRAKMKVRRRVDTVGKKASYEVPDNIEVCRLDDDTTLLWAETDRPYPPDPGDLPAFAFEHYEGAEGWHAFVDMFSFASEDVEAFHLSLFSEPTRPTERDATGGMGETYEYSRDTFTGDELPLGVDSVADLSGRAFRVVGPDGTVYVRGVLPELQRPRLPMPPEIDPPPREEPPIDFPGFPEFPFFEQPARDGPNTTRDAAKTVEIWNGIPGTDELPPWGDDPIRIMPPELFPFPLPEREPSRLRLEIADDEGALTDVGHLDRIVFPEIDWPEPPPPPRDPPPMDRPPVDRPPVDCPNGGHGDDGHTGGDGTTR